MALAIAPTRLGHIATARQHFGSVDQPRDDKGRWANVGSHDRIVRQNKGTSAKFNYAAAEWAQGLSNGDRETIKKYRGPYSKQIINSYNAGHPVDAGKELVRVASTAPEYKGKAFRGMLLTQEAYDKFQPGVEFKVKTPTSFSRDINVADTWSLGRGGSRVPGAEHSVILHVQSYSSRAIESVSNKWERNSRQSEKEVLYLPGSKFRVVGVKRATTSRDPWGHTADYTHVYLKERK